jgi:hypothetical protein
MRSIGVGSVRARIVIALASAAMLLPVQAPVPVSAAAAQLLPDLQLEPLFNLYIQETAKHRLLLRFGTLLDNIGDGPMIVRASKRVNKKLTRVVQRIRLADGTFQDIRQPNAIMYWEHTSDYVHWHLRDILTVKLTPLTQTDPPTERRTAKVGFCLADTDQMPVETRPPNSAPAREFNNCGTAQSTKVRMGISVGWGDNYEPYYKYQWVEVTGLPAGDYRLCALIDAQGLWQEKSKDNNSLYMDLTIDPAAKTVVVNSTVAGPCETPPT